MIIIHLKLKKPQRAYKREDDFETAELFFDETRHNFFCKSSFSYKIYSILKHNI